MVHERYDVGPNVAKLSAAYPLGVRRQPEPKLRDAEWIVRLALIFDDLLREPEFAVADGVRIVERRLDLLVVAAFPMQPAPSIPSRKIGGVLGEREAKGSS